MPKQQQSAELSTKQLLNPFCQTSSSLGNFLSGKNCQSNGEAFDARTIKQTLDKVANLYGQLVDRYGFDARSAGAENYELRQMRFDLLAKVIDLNIANNGISINDLGCGYGAMFAYLDRLESIKLTKYYGYDISRQMLDAAQNFVKNPKAQFIESSRVTQQADYSFISGIFNVKFDCENEVWTQYIKQTLINVAANSNQGFAFYLLKPYSQLSHQQIYHNDSSISPPLKEEDRYFADPDYFKSFCKTELPYFIPDWEGANISFEQDYGLFEWTMIVHKKIINSYSNCKN